MRYVNKVNGKITFQTKKRMDKDQIAVEEDDPGLLAFISKQSAALTPTEVYDRQMVNNPVLKAIVSSLNNGGKFSADGSKLTPTKLKNLIKENM